MDLSNAGFMPNNLEEPVDPFDEALKPPELQIDSR